MQCAQSRSESSSLVCRQYSRTLDFASRGVIPEIHGRRLVSASEVLFEGQEILMPEPIGYKNVEPPGVMVNV